MSLWAPAVARARGLRSRLLPPETLRAVERSDDPATLRRALEERRYAVADPGDAWAVEAALRAGMAAEMAALRRWLRPPQARAVGALFVDEDRRTVRRLLRGLLAGRSPAVRALAALPTPGLPADALAGLAEQPTVPALAARLAQSGSPFGAIAEEASRPEPRAAQLEMALDRGAAAVLAGARRDGGPALAAFARSWIDGANACTAVILAGPERETAGAESFLAGGHRVTPALFDAALAAVSPAAAARRLAEALPGELGRALARGVMGRGRLEAALARDLLAEQRALARRLPLSAAPVAVYALALQAEAATLRRAAWRLELGLAEEAA